MILNKALSTSLPFFVPPTVLNEINKQVFLLRFLHSVQ